MTTPELFAADAPKTVTITFPFVWPALKNTKEIIQIGRGATARMTIRTRADVREASAEIRRLVHRKLTEFQLEGHGLPLFGGNDVRRDLVWDVEAGTITVTWTDLGPNDSKAARKRDLTNLGALLDDSVGRERVGRRLVGQGLLYRDDSQVAHATETRRGQI